MSRNASPLSKAFNLLSPGRVKRLNAQLLALARQPGPDALEQIRKLVASGAEVDAANAHGDTALNLLCAAGDPAAGGLVRLGADITKANNSGMTPFLSAAVAGNPTVLKMLIAAGADVRQTTQSGDNALALLVNVPPEGITDLTKKAARCEALALLREAGLPLNGYFEKRIYNFASFLLPAVPELAQVHALETAAEKDPAAAIALLGTGIHPDAPAVFGGASVLSWAARLGHAELAQAAIGAGADVNLPSAGGIFASPLQKAAWFAQQDLFRLLLDAGADWKPGPPGPGLAGKPLAQIAREGGHPGMAKFIVVELHERFDKDMALERQVSIRPIRLKAGPGKP